MIESLRRAGFWHAGGAIGSTGAREFELVLLLGGSRKAAVQLWKWERRQRIYANAQQAAGQLHKAVVVVAQRGAKRESPT